MSPEAAATPRPQFRPTMIMEFVSDYLAAQRGTVRTAQVTSAIRGCRSGYVGQALKVLADEGYIARRRTRRGGYSYRFIKRYTVAQDEQ